MQSKLDIATLSSPEATESANLGFPSLPHPQTISMAYSHESWRFRHTEVCDRSGKLRLSSVGEYLPEATGYTRGALGVP